MSSSTSALLLLYLCTLMSLASLPSSLSSSASCCSCSASCSLWLWSSELGGSLAASSFSSWPRSSSATGGRMLSCGCFCFLSGRTLVPKSGWLRFHVGTSMLLVLLLSYCSGSGLTLRVMWIPSGCATIHVSCSVFPRKIPAFQILSPFLLIFSLFAITTVPKGTSFPV